MKHITNMRHFQKKIRHMYCDNPTSFRKHIQLSYVTSNYYVTTFPGYNL